MKGLNSRQRRQFCDDGFLILRNILKARELKALNDIADALYCKHRGEAYTGRMEIRNCAAHDPLLLRMVDHPAILPIVVELLGPDIRIRTSELDVRPPLQHRGAVQSVGSKRWGEPEHWHIDGPIYGYPHVNGLLPMMEVRVGYFLTDVRKRDSGCLCLARGSHKLDYRHLFDNDLRVSANNVVRVQVPPGSAVLFRTGVWHCVTPNYSDKTRKVLYLAYTFRWIFASDYLQQDDALLARCNPVQRQLLGGAEPGRHPLGSDPVKTPRLLYWFTTPEDIPLIEFQRGSKKRRLRHATDRQA